MSEHYDELLQGLEEALEIKKGTLKGRITRYNIEPVVQYEAEDVRRIRMEKGMSQSVFALLFGVSKKTVEAWERGTNRLSGPVCRILSMIDSSEESIPFYSESR